MAFLSRMRQSFVGLTDKYLSSPSVMDGEFLDVTGTFFNEHQRDITSTRLSRYKKNWSFYKGDQFIRSTSEGKEKLVINYVKPICNKSVDWLFGHGWKINAPPGNDAIVPLLDMIWQANNKDVLLWEHGQMGAVTGDAFLYVSVQDRDSSGNPIPLEQQRILILNLNPAYVHPVYNSIDTREMEAVLIQIPSTVNPQNAQQANAYTSRATRPLGVYSIIITKTEIVEYWNREEILNSRRENFLKRVPVVHTRNLPLASSFYGLSDIEDVLSLNQKLNEVGEGIDSIIEYHSAPTTVIFGARAANLDKGPNKLWSGLPKDAKVENLQLQGDLKAAVDHFQALKLAIHELTNTPESSLGKIQQISNTSAAALEVQYLPLIEKTRRKYLTYGASLVQVNEIILQIIEERFGMDVSGMVEDASRVYETSVEFNSPLPTDKKIQLDLIAAKVNAGFESKAGALRELGVKDIRRKILEIIADRRETLAEDIERATSVAAGTVPNLSVFSLGSLALNSDEAQQALEKSTEQYVDAVSADEEKMADDEAKAQAKAQVPARITDTLSAQEVG